MYPDWPITVRMEENYGRKAAAWLPTIHVTGMKDPVVQVIDEETLDYVYTLRIKGTRFRPKVFKPGWYTLKVGEVGTPFIRTFGHVHTLAPGERRTLEVRF